MRPGSAQQLVDLQQQAGNGAVTRMLQRQPAPAPAPPAPAGAPPAPAPAPTPQQLVDAAAARVRTAVTPVAAPLVGTPEADDLPGILAQQIIRRRPDTSAALRRRNPAHPALPLYAVLYRADIVADLATIDTSSPGRRARDRRRAADATRREIFADVLGGLITDVQPHTAVAAPAAPLAHATQVAGERAMVPAVLPFIASGRTWDDVRVGVITEFGGLVDGTRTALARAQAYYRSLVVPTFRNVTGATRVHPDLNAALVRANAAINTRLATTPQPRRTELTTEIATSLGRNTFSAVLRENRNSPHRLSDHSFGFAIDIDSPRNPNIGSKGGLGPVQDVTGRNPVHASTRGQTMAQVEAVAAALRLTSEQYVAAMASNASFAPVLLRLANAGRAAVTPPLPALTSGDPLVAAVLVADDAARATALRAAIWPEIATAPAPAPARGRRAAPPAPPAQVVAAETRIARAGAAFRTSFSNAARTARVGAATEGTPGSVAAHGFLSLSSLLVGALSGSDAGNLRWLGTENQDFMHFELATRPPLFTPGAVADPAPPPAPGAPAPAGAPPVPAGGGAAPAGGGAAPAGGGAAPAPGGAAPAPGAPPPAVPAPTTGP